MKRLTEMPLGDGTSIFVETDEPEGARGFRDVANAPDRTATLATTLEQSLQAMKPALRKIKASLNELNHPDSIDVQFGIKIVGGVGAVFASASTEANFTVKLSWKRAKAGEEEEDEEDDEDTVSEVEKDGQEKE